jgi:hypothetical protein
MRKMSLLASMPCAVTRQPQVGRFESRGEGWVLIGISRQRPGSVFRAEETKGMSGEFGIAPDYKGCPSCGATEYAQCGRCSSMACYDPSRRALRCPTCGQQGPVDGYIERVSSLGGG